MRNLGPTPLLLVLLTTAACEADPDDTGPGVELVDVWIEASTPALTTRDTVEMTLLVENAFGQVVDATDEAIFTSSDPAILDFFEPTTGQPILGGAVTITGSIGGYEDTVEVAVTLSPVQLGDLVFNEVLSDATVDGDPNGDGTTDGVEDEFVEIANRTGVTVDLSGAMLVERSWSEFLPRHTFAEETLLRAGEAIVVFGGGDAESLSADFATFVIADNDDPGTLYGLSLEDTGETMRLLADDGATVLASVSFGAASGGTPPAPDDASLVLDPEVTGTAYVDHAGLGDAIGWFSPGTYADGSAFEGPRVFYGGEE
ncbi:MAG: lamin tail domain-containing protein [Deltaproteobacteria bacterium]|nr:lamin tail domain-containing protein [Deltaproteobacteria bacterium]MBW2255233.1 lamin tail domain-containing protein [Deltaproteobacteria bacterium]